MNRWIAVVVVWTGLSPLAVWEASGEVANKAAGYVNLWPCEYVDPAEYPCTDGSHGCDANEGGLCVAKAPCIAYQLGQWSCTCKPGYKCTAGCMNQKSAHTCADPAKNPAVAAPVAADPAKKVDASGGAAAGGAVAAKEDHNAPVAFAPPSVGGKAAPALGEVKLAPSCDPPKPGTDPSQQKCSKCVMLPKGGALRYWVGDRNTGLCTECQPGHRFNPTHRVGAGGILVGTCVAAITAAIKAEAERAFSGKTMSLNDYLDLAWAARHTAKTFVKYQSASTVLAGNVRIDDALISNHISVVIGRQRTIFGVPWKGGKPKKEFDDLRGTIDYSGCSYAHFSTITSFVKIGVSDHTLSAVKTRSGQRLAAAVAGYFFPTKTKSEDAKTKSEAAWNDLKRVYKDPQKLAKNLCNVCCEKIAGKMVLQKVKDHPTCVIALGKDMQKVKDHPFWSRPNIKLYLKHWMDAMTNVRTVV